MGPHLEIVGLSTLFLTHKMLIGISLLTTWFIQVVPVDCNSFTHKCRHFLALIPLL